MAEFILTGFGDEIDAALDVQMDVMEKLDIHYIETRGIDGKNIADYTPAEAKAVFARMQARGFGVSALGSPIGKISIRDPFLPHLDSFRNLLDVAHAMQTPYHCIFSFFLPECEPRRPFRDEVLERLGRLVEAARGSGVQLPAREREAHLRRRARALPGDPQGLPRGDPGDVRPLQLCAVRREEPRGVRDAAALRALPARQGLRLHRRGSRGRQGL